MKLPHGVWRPSDRAKRAATRVIRNLKRFIGVGGNDPLGEPTSSDKYMEDLENMTPFCQLAGRLKLTIREATFIMQMLDDIDQGGTGVVSGAEVFAYFDINAPPAAADCLLANALLHREKLEYHEMLISLYNYCSLPLNRMAEYVYQVLDEMGAGSIEREVILDSIPRIYSKASQDDLDTLTRRVRKTIATTRTGTVTLDDWRRVQKKNPTLLMPIVEARRRLQEACMGPRFWRDRTEERSRIFEDTDQPGFVIIDMLEVVVNKRSLDLGPLSPKEEEEQDPHEFAFETPREEAEEEAYRQEMMDLIHEKRRIAERKRTALQKAETEANRLKSEAQKLKGEAIKMKEEASNRMKAEAQKLEEAASQAVTKLKKAANLEEGGEEEEEYESDEGDDEEGEASEGQEETEHWEGDEGDEEASTPVQRSGDWWTEDEVERGDGHDAAEGPALLHVGEDVADVIRLFYAKKAEGVALLASVENISTKEGDRHHT